mmetsp:Transcript_93101/g.203815  ORF Transcript_93101/g.203815 Transcript_93101/m.203815 type:complete len:220 (-) Transcript_93101:2369-3028(-)
MACPTSAFAPVYEWTEFQSVGSSPISTQRWIWRRPCYQELSLRRMAEGVSRSAASTESFGTMVEAMYRFAWILPLVGKFCPDLLELGVTFDLEQQRRLLISSFQILARAPGTPSKRSSFSPFMVKRSLARFDRKASTDETNSPRLRPKHKKRTMECPPPSPKSRKSIDQLCAASGIVPTSRSSATERPRASRGSFGSSDSTRCPRAIRSAPRKQTRCQS